MLHVLRPLPMPVAALYAGSALAPITITSSATFSIPENSTAVATLTASGGTGSFTWTKIGGADIAKFTLTSGGVLTFAIAPDFEVPTDANADNVYLVQVQAADGVSTPATQNVSVTVTDVAEAALDLDFIAMAGTLDSRITFTRAGSATYVNSSGVITTAGTNVPRFHHHPTTHAVLGLLMETGPGATSEQEVRQSHAFGTSPWTLNNATLATGIASPDGASNAATITGSGSGTRNGLTQTLGSRNPGASTWSIWAKPGTSNYLVIEGDIDGAGGTKRKAWFNLATGAVGTVEASATASMQQFDGGWYRCSLTLTTTAAAAGTIAFGPAAADNVWAAETGTVSVFGAQFERNPVATSYIPTTTVSLNRAQDIAVMTGTNFSSWYNASAGTFVTNFNMAVLGTTRAIVAVNDNTGNELISISTTITPLGQLVVVDGGASQAAINTANAPTAGVTQKIAAAYAHNDFAVSLNGGTVGTDVSGTLPSPDRLFLGAVDSGGNSPMIGLLRRVQFFNTRKSNADLITLST